MEQDKFFITYDTPIGKIAITAETYQAKPVITALYFPVDLAKPGFLDGLAKEYKQEETPLLKKAGKELFAYFSGKQKTFDLPLYPKGTDFQKRVWQVLCSIPYGEVWSYGKVGAVVDCPKGARAVGLANNRNPIPIFIPCHRVVGANGKLVGFGGGLDIKDQLLNLEKADIKAVVTK